MTLRRTPLDFQVDERLDSAWLDAMASEWSEGFEHGVYRLTKTSLATPEALALVCAAARVPTAAGSYAGLKDKHAVTSQHVTVRAPEEKGWRGLPPDMEGHGWRAHRVGWTSQPIAAAAIRANEFTLVVRDLDAAAVDAMRRSWERLLQPPGELLLANYYGDQRFGSARHGEGFAAEAMVAGDYGRALRLLVGTPSRKDRGRAREFTRLCAAHWGDWPLLATTLPRCPERTPFERLARGATEAEAFVAAPRFLQLMAIEAFQGLLWNDMLRRMVRSLGEPAVVARDDFGEMVFAAPASVPADWVGRLAPLPAPGAALDGPWAPHLQAALAARGVSLDGLVAPGLTRPYFGQAERALFVAATDASLAEPVADELSAGGALRVTVRFSLPRGAYATVAMRALGQ
jgi:tRNA pseudouridine13 synthase